MSTKPALQPSMQAKRLGKLDGPVGKLGGRTFIQINKFINLIIHIYSFIYESQSQVGTLPTIQPAYLPSLITKSLPVSLPACSA